MLDGAGFGAVLDVVGCGGAVEPVDDGVPLGVVPSPPPDRFVVGTPPAAKASAPPLAFVAFEPALPDAPSGDDAADLSELVQPTPSPATTTLTQAHVTLTLPLRTNIPGESRTSRMRYAIRPAALRDAPRRSASAK